ncbi:MAG: hypothetical protein REI45_05405, partial [Propionicimonas sp.]|nr:hypothetical protein [Propionicimonas sp.]
MLPIVGLLPGLIAWLVLGAMVACSLLLATRWMRWPAIGWFLGGTRLPADVDVAIRPLLEVSACVSDGRHIDMGLAAPGVRTTVVGPNIILLDRSLVDGYCAGKVDSQSLACTLAHRVAQLRLGYTRFDLTALAVDSVADAQAAGPDHAWRLDVGDEPVVVAADATRITQVVANLLANARVHTPAGTTISTSVR